MDTLKAVSFVASGLRPSPHSPFFFLFFLLSSFFFILYSFLPQYEHGQRWRRGGRDGLQRGGATLHGRTQADDRGRCVCNLFSDFIRVSEVASCIFICICLAAYNLRCQQRILQLLPPLTILLPPFLCSIAPPQARRSAGTARACWAATTRPCWWPARAAMRMKMARTLTERARRDSTQG